MYVEDQNFQPSACVCSLLRPRSRGATSSPQESSRSRLANFTRSRSALLRLSFLQQIEERELIFA